MVTPAMRFEPHASNADKRTNGGGMGRGALLVDRLLSAPNKYLHVSKSWRGWHRERGEVYSHRKTGRETCSRC